MNKLKHILLTLMLIVCLPISAQTISGFKRVSVSVMPNDDTVLKSVGLNTSNELVWFTKLPQVNSDWNATSGPSQILNKPIIATPTFQSVLNAGKTAFAFDQEEHFRLTSQWYTGGPIHNTIFKRNSISLEFQGKGYEFSEVGVTSLAPFTGFNTGFNLTAGGLNMKTNPVAGGAATIKSDNMQNNHIIQLPSTSGTLPMIINGQTADIFGNVTISETPQVNSDWNSTSGPSQILNKPVIPASVIYTSQQVFANEMASVDIKGINYVRTSATDDYQGISLTGTHEVGVEYYVKNTSNYLVQIIGGTENINGNQRLDMPPGSYWHLIKEDNGTNSITAFNITNKSFTSQQVVAGTTTLEDIKDLSYVRAYATANYQSIALTGPHELGKEYYVKNPTNYIVYLKGFGENINGNQTLVMPPKSYWHLIKEDNGTNTITAFNITNKSVISQQVIANSDATNDIKSIPYSRVQATEQDQAISLTGTHNIGIEYYVKNPTAFTVELIGQGENINGNQKLIMPPNSYWHLIKEDNGTNSITAFNISTTPSYFKTINGVSILGSGDIVISEGVNTPVSDTLSGIVNNISLQELGGVDKLINGIRIGKGSGNNIENTVFGIDALSANTTGGWNDAFGTNALNLTTTGTSNTAIGNYTLSSNTTGGYNTGLGGSLYSNVSGSLNVGIGSGALANNVSGNRNVVVGAASGTNVLGSFNTAIGSHALSSADGISGTGNYNIAIGFQSGRDVTSGSNNLLIENITNASITTGSNNIILDPVQKTGITTGSNNLILGGYNGTFDSATSNTVALGTGAGVTRFLSNDSGLSTIPTQTNILINSDLTGKALLTKEYFTGNVKTINGNSIIGTGDIAISGGSSLPAHLEYNATNKTIWNNGFGNQGLNTIFGENALISNTSGWGNTTLGSNTLKFNTTGSSNTALGSDALKLNTTGGNNIAIGDRTLTANTTGNSNTVVGSISMEKNTSGTNNIVMGYGTLGNNTSGNNNLVLGNSSLGSNTLGNDNIVLGSTGMHNNTTGNGNISIGNYAGTYVSSTGTNPNTVSDQSIYIGENARPEASGQTNQIVIGRLAYGGGSNTVTVGNNNVQKTILKGTVETNGIYKLQNLNTAPTSSSDVGVLGEIRVTSEYIYVCTATNTWVRSALSTW